MWSARKVSTEINKRLYPGFDASELVYKTNVAKVTTTAENIKMRMNFKFCTAGF
jgi:hypothetical protein